MHIALTNCHCLLKIYLRAQPELATALHSIATSVKTPISLTLNVIDYERFKSRIIALLECELNVLDSPERERMLSNKYLLENVKAFNSVNTWLAMPMPHLGEEYALLV